MKCSNCGKPFRLKDVTLADASPPGVFFWIGMVFVILTVVAALYGSVLLFPFGLVALITAGAMITSTVDNNGGYGKPKCPHCGTENSVSFWQL